jgi:opacity protein-like surface antigen
MANHCFLIFGGLFILSTSFAQIPNNSPVYTKSTFYSSRIVNSHTTESIEKKVLDFRINHRFGVVSGGYQTFYGLDNASMRLSFDYGITDNITIGVGRSTFEKNIDGYAKYRFLRQIDKNGNMPISAAYVAAISMNGQTTPTGRTNYFSSRLSYAHQLIVARKFSNTFSAQLMPLFIHRNLIDSIKYNNDILGLGIGIKQKIVPSVTLNLEYFYVLPNQISDVFVHPLSLGIDIHTGWHTFQLHVTNATGTFEKSYLTQTRNKWKDGEIQFGFNISRQFHPRGSD